MPIITLTLLIALAGSLAAQTSHFNDPVVNVRDFGAKGDGVANDTLAFYAAAQALQQAGSGTLVIPKATYLVGLQTHGLTPDHPNPRYRGRVENIHTHHHGRDGIIIGWKKLAEDDPSTPHTLININSEYNCRQGLSWVGGRGLTAINCKFNHTGRAAFTSPPIAGLDIEAEVSVCRDGLFVNCEFLNNAGCGLVADTGDGGYTKFINCTFWGTTNWSIWANKPGLKFEDCNIHGAIVRGVGSDDPDLAT